MIYVSDNKGLFDIILSKKTQKTFEYNLLLLIFLAQ